MFDNAFDKPNEVIDPLAELKAKFNARVEKARQEAYEEGREAGRQEALTTIENETKTSLEALLADITSLNSQYRDEMTRLEQKAVEFGITAGSKLAGELIRREPLPLLEQFFANAFKVIGGVPEVTARVSPKVHQPLLDAISQWQAKHGHDGEIRLITDESLKPGDVALTWAEGGVERSLDKLMAAIQTAMTDYFTARLEEPSAVASATIEPPQLEAEATPELTEITSQSEQSQ